MKAIDHVDAPDDRPVRARFHTPARDLAQFVIDYAIYDSGPAGSFPRSNIYAPGPANIALTFNAGPVRARIRHWRHEWTDGSVLFGPTSHPIHVESNGGRLIGFGLTPLGWSRLIPHSADKLANRVTPLSGVIGAFAERRLHTTLAAADDDAAIVATLDMSLRRWLLPPGEDEAVIRALSDALLDPAVGDVARIVDRLDISPRQVRRVASRYFGFAPKLLLRRIRFMRALMAMAETDPATIDFGSVAPGYHDKSHFIRDAQLFLDMTGRRFLRDITPLMETMRQGRRARFGQPLQGLMMPGRDNIGPQLDDSRPPA
ncbi:helix-turn-helix domain-containing protein [Sphingomonas sp. SUN019]|uniref:AraC family transcriptional regulator n=1 Tax=Sphingomonas sp. SUN019 TaxID=2937788 RepID=UPI002164BEEA|nr:helix-turn-helix domain-containing protein [Sphingomonas sp. SUN019]UVO52027.1 helix-turn-helix domain-containing protein [Sphingomonas sp. SUN019]